MDDGALERAAFMASKSIVSVSAAFEFDGEEEIRMRPLLADDAALINASLRFILIGPRESAVVANGYAVRRIDSSSMKLMVDYFTTYLWCAHKKQKAKEISDSKSKDTFYIVLRSPRHKEEKGFEVRGLTFCTIAAAQLFNNSKHHQHIPIISSSIMVGLSSIIHLASLAATASAVGMRGGTPAHSTLVENSHALFIDEAEDYRPATAHPQHTNRGPTNTVGQPCTTTTVQTDCDPPELYYCQATDIYAGCTTSGTCTAIDRTVMCKASWEPVCGCDGNTYSNDCHAKAAGMNVFYHHSACAEEAEDTATEESSKKQEFVDYATILSNPGATCSTSTSSCGNPSKYFCRINPGDCEGDDGVCTDYSTPIMCMMNYSPVCSCDGNIYSNVCDAIADGKNVECQLNPGHLEKGQSTCDCARDGLDVSMMSIE